MSELTQDNFLSLTGAYVLNALTPEEVEAFEAKLESSEQARDEVTELADTAVLLGLAVAPVAPSAALKSNLMAQLDSTPQKAEKASESVVKPAEVVDIASALNSSSKAVRKAQARWFKKPLLAAASIAVAASFVVVGITGQNNGTAGIQNQADNLASISQSADTQKTVSSIAGGGTATVMWSDKADSSAVFVKDVPTLTDNKDYQLWYINKDGSARSAGILSKNSIQHGWQVLSGKLDEGDVVGVTVEPQGGSQQPTTKPIVTVQTA